MRLLLVLAAFLVFAVAANGASAATVYVTNTSTVVTDQQLQDALPAFQAALDEDFSLYWPGAQLVTGAPPVGAWRIELSDTSDIQGALGYHYAPGSPLGKVFAQTSIEDGVGWQVVFTHELFEMLADPYINRTVKEPALHFRPGGWYALEVADPVETDSYTRPSASGRPVEISDFVLENWYRRGTHGPYDFMGVTRKPLEIRPGGYQSIFNDGWLSVDGCVLVAVSSLIALFRGDEEQGEYVTPLFRPELVALICCGLEPEPPNRFTLAEAIYPWLRDLAPRTDVKYGEELGDAWPVICKGYELWKEKK